MAYTEPEIGSSDWGVSLNAALSDINDTAEDSVAGGGAGLGTQETTASTSYADLSTVGPSVSVTLTEPRAVLVLYGAEVLQVSTTDDVFMSFAATGATTLSADDARAMRHNGSGTAEAYSNFTVVACNAGTTTFTAKYRVQGGSGQYAQRRIAVVVT